MRIGLFFVLWLRKIDAYWSVDVQCQLLFPLPKKMSTFHLVNFFNKQIILDNRILKIQNQLAGM